MRALRPFLLCFTIVSLSSGGVHADWPQFRGVNSSGIAPDDMTLPTEFGPGKNELWSIDVKPGHSSPCIASGSIYLTTYDSEKKELNVESYQKDTGQLQWRSAFRPERFETGHPSFNPASSSPATDGERVVAYFGSYGLVCLSRTGDLIWEIRMPVTKSYAGNATSPAIIGNKVILYRCNHVDHFLMAVDKETGEVVWKIPQQEPFVSELACTACPIIAGDRLIVHGARSVQGFAIETGERLWVAKCATTATSTPVLADGQVIVAAWNKMGEPALRPKFPTFDQLVADHDKDGDQLINRREFPKLFIFHRPDGAEAPQNGAPMRFDQSDGDRDGKLTKEEWSNRVARIEAFRAHYETHGILAIPVDGEGIVGADQVRTLELQSIPEVPSPLFHDGIVYFVKNGGVLTCLDLKSGKRTTRVRTGGRGTPLCFPDHRGRKAIHDRGGRQGLCPFVGREAGSSRGQ